MLPSRVKKVFGCHVRFPIGCLDENCSWNWNCSRDIITYPNSNFSPFVSFTNICWPQLQSRGHHLQLHMSSHRNPLNLAAMMRSVLNSAVTFLTLELLVYNYQGRSNGLRSSSTLRPNSSVFVYRSTSDLL